MSAITKLKDHFDKALSKPVDLDSYIGNDWWQISPAEAKVFGLPENPTKSTYCSDTPIASPCGVRSGKQKGNLCSATSAYVLARRPRRFL